MRRIGISLAAVVLLACLGLGLALDRLHDHLGEAPAPGTGPQIEVLARTLAAVLEQAQPAQLPPGLGLHSGAALSLPAELRADFERGQPLLLETSHGLRLHMRLPKGERQLALELPTRAADRPGGAGLSLALTLLFYLGVLGLVLLWLRPLLQRLEQLRQAARGFGQGQLARRVAPAARSYIADIETEFNRMAQRIQTLIEDNRLLGNAVSHDLRTPLARLRFGVDALGEAADADTRERYRRHLSRDIARMESLVELLLGYARLEQQRDGHRHQPLQLREVVDAARRAAWSGTGPRLRVDATAAGLPVRGDRQQLQMLLDNLLQNAFGHARSEVLIGLQLQDGQAMLSVEDDGPGIAPPERERVLKPFERGAVAERAGHGLGLAIVARIADWHGASLLIDQSPQLGGARIALRFPLDPA